MDVPVREHISAGVTPTTGLNPSRTHRACSQQTATQRHTLATRPAVHLLRHVGRSIPMKPAQTQG
eukprot:2923167-Pleurochrysis_carterae.AAC.1